MTKIILLVIMNFKNHVFVFDLDDTLYKEIDFAKSAYLFIASKLERKLGKNIYQELLNGMQLYQNPFSEILLQYEGALDINQLLNWYRFHEPSLILDLEVLQTLEYLFKNGTVLAVLTDGRAITQKNKLAALNIGHFFSKIYISEEIGTEKPHENNYLMIQNDFEAEQFVYIGDNFNKDFLTPNKFGWDTIGLLDNGQNIHKQNMNLPSAYLPKKTVKNLKEILSIYS